jgi:hypothetical protein
MTWFMGNYAQAASAILDDQLLKSTLWTGTVARKYKRNNLLRNPTASH